MPTLLKTTTVAKNLTIATINQSTLCCMGLVIALCLLRFSPLLWELTPAKLLRSVTAACHRHGQEDEEKTNFFKVKCQDKPC